MRRMRVLATAVAVAVAVGVISFKLGRTLSVREPVATGMPAKIAEPELVTGTIASLRSPCRRSRTRRRRPRSRAPLHSRRPTVPMPPPRRARPAGIRMRSASPALWRSIPPAGPASASSNSRPTIS